MTTVNLEDVQDHLADFIERASPGEAFMLVKAGTPFAHVTPLGVPSTAGEREIGFLDGQFKVPDNFDDIDSDEIAALFEGRL